MRLRNPLFTFSLVAVIHLSSFAQSDSSFLTRAISELSQQPAAEKVYLHLDKPGGYFYGDTIWYKAYAVIGQHHQLSALSGVLYVELINSHDSIVNRQTLRLMSGIAWGNIPLSRKLSQGSYRICAYTNWMRNAPDYFYDQKIRIGGIAPVLSNHAVKNPDVQFFPEGGQLVNGVRSRVAVKAIGANGLGVDITGTVEDNDGNVVAEFVTRHLGMGVFPLISQTGKTYKVKITIPGDAPFMVDLPKAVEEGFTLSLNNSQKDSIYIKIAVNDKVLTGGKGSNFYIVAQNNGNVYYTSQGKLESLVYSARVEKSRFPTGITQFTLFSQNGEPLAERIAFIQSADTLKLNIKSANQNYSTRQKVKIELNTSDKDNKPATGSLSVAVINESGGRANENEESTIMNNLLLTSDLKGYIEQPNYYFINSSDERQADLDILMLTQGYRRFEWKQVLNKPGRLFSFQPERSLELAGTLKTPAGKPVPNGKITLLATGEKFISDTAADVNGNFKFTDLNLSETAKIVLRARKENNGSNVIINIDPKNSHGVIKQKEVDVNINLSSQVADIEQNNYNDYQRQFKQDSLRGGRLLKEVNVKSTRINKRPELTHSDNLNGSGNADQVIMGDKLEGCVTLSDCLQGKVFGVTFGRNGAPYSIRSQGRLSGSVGMVIIVDGNILPGSSLNDMNANDVYSIEVLRSGSYLAIYGSNAPGGALVITTRRGGDPNYSQKMIPSGLITYAFKGFYKAKSFYSPKYTHPKTDAEPLDLRNTIYWNPNIITDKNGNASFEYFNNDSKGTYRVVVEGIDDNGNLGRQIFRYIVK